MENSTHIVFDGQRIVISPDIRPVFTFLQNIEKEVEAILGFNERLRDIKSSFSDLFELVLFLSNKLNDNNIDFEFKLKEHPNKIPEKLRFEFPLRSQMIVLFASLEVLFTLHMAYELQTIDEGKLKKSTMDSGTTKRFINKFILSENNDFYRLNKSRFANKLDAGKIRGLRNSLTHFFSVSGGGLSISPEAFSSKSREFEAALKRNKHVNIIFISEQDLYGLIKGANIVRLKMWSDDFSKNQSLFRKQIRYVIELVEKEGAIILNNREMEDLNPEKRA